MTRSTDEFVTISQRWNRAHAAKAQLFVSLHENAFDGDSTISGFSVLYPKPDSIPFAEAIERGLAAALAPFGRQDDGLAAKPELWVHSDIPTATIESAYLTNPTEAQLLHQKDFRQAIVRGIYQGLMAADPTIQKTAALPSASRRSPPPNVRRTWQRRRPPALTSNGQAFGTSRFSSEPS